MLASRGMSAPDGRMLFEYRLSMVEFSELRELISLTLKANTRSGVQFPSRSDCATFVLYSAEWWRRKYSGGAWRWNQIYASLSENEIQTDANERAHAVERGLHYWGLQPSSVGKKYFGALVAQGGLPLQMIAQGDGAIAGLLIRAIRLTQQFNWDDVGLMRFFEENNNALVQHIRQPEIYRLLASIVTTVIGLRIDFSLAGLDDPIAALSQREPNWQERFPIALDEGSAGILLIALVKEVAREVHRPGGSPFVVSRYLERTTGDQFQLRSIVRMPNAIPLDDLASVCALQSGDFPRYFRFDLMVSHRSTLCEARTVLNAGASIVSLNGRSRSIVGAAAALEHLLVCRSEGIDLHDPVGLPGGASLDDELPWVFANRNDAFVLAAVGSCRLPDEQVHVVLEENSILRSADAQSLVTRLGVLELDGRKQVVYEVSGTAEATLSEDGSVFRFQTKQIIAPPDQLVWKGKRVPYPTKPWTIFLGVPRLYSYSSGGDITPIPAKDIEWYTPHGETILDIRLHRGPVVVWILNNGTRISRLKIVIEDANAAINLLSAGDEATGSIRLRNWRVSDFGTDLNSRQELTRQDDAATLTLSVNGKPPSNVNLSLLWRSNWPGITLSVPFPSSGGRFFDGHGQRLQNNAVIPLRKIYGVRINVFDRNPQQVRAYRIELELKNTLHCSRQPSLHTTLGFPVDAQGLGELRLIDIQTKIESLLCQSDELDTAVTVRLADNVRTIASIKITRYDTELLKNATRVELTPAASVLLAVDGNESPAMLAIRLFDTTGEPVLIGYKSNGENSMFWDLEVLGHQANSWLLYPSPGSPVQFRPIFYRPIILAADNGPSSSDEIGRCPLGTAMELGDVSVRHEFISRIVEEMAIDLGHPSWKFLERHYRLLGHLPLSTLDSWRLLARNPRACLTCLIKFSHDVQMLATRLSSELGVVWELIPRCAVIECIAAMKKEWQFQLGDAASPTVLRLVTETQLNSINREIPSLSTTFTLARFWSDLCGPECVANIERDVSKGVHRLLGHLWSGPDCLLQQLLLRGHADDVEWPNFGLVLKAIEELETFLDEHIMATIRKHVSSLFWVNRGIQNQQGQDLNKLDVANLPVICAVWTYFGGPPTWWRIENRLLELRSIRDFDPVWFEETYRTTILVCVAIDRETAAMKRTARPNTPASPTKVATLKSAGPNLSIARRVSKQ